MELRPYPFCLSFCLLYFFLPPFEDNGLLFWVPDVLCQHSEVVLWNLLSVQMFFWWICGGESGLPVLFLRHLRTTLRLFSNNRNSTQISITIQAEINLGAWTTVLRLSSSSCLTLFFLSLTVLNGFQVPWGGLHQLQDHILLGSNAKKKNIYLFLRLGKLCLIGSAWVISYLWKNHWNQGIMQRSYFPIPLPPASSLEPENESLWKYLEKWSVSCHISKQECNSHQLLQPSDVSPKGTQEGEQYLSCQPSGYSHSLQWAPRKLSSVQLLTRVWLFETQWTEALQAFLSITNSQSLLKLMSIDSVMQSNHFIFCHPLLLPSIFPSIRVFLNESVLRIRWPKYGVSASVSVLQGSSGYEKCRILAPG